MIRARLTFAGIATAACLWAGAAQDDACVAAADGSLSTACRAYLQGLADDRSVLRAAIGKLEADGRYRDAAAMYRQALVLHPGDRALSQGLIRARRAAKASAWLSPGPVTPAAPVAPATTPVPTPAAASVPTDAVARCHDQRWHDALAHCETAVARHPRDARLAERYADVLRSVGVTRGARRAYANVIELDPSADGAVHKRQALDELVAQGPVPEQPAAPSTTVQKLELLSDLLARGLIDNTEFAERRSALLAAALGEPASEPPPAAPAGRNVALIIGNDRYEDFVTLQTPQADARGVAAVLRNRYGFETNTLLNATRYEIVKALSQLRKSVGDGDSLLIYYAGHGFLDEKTKRGYWLPVDAERDNFANWISTSDVTDTLAGVSARHALVVADSCFSGTLLRDGGGADLDERSELLARLASKRSRTVLTSGGLEPVLDDGDGKHSVFARVFLDALRTNQGVLEAGRLFLTLRDRVTRDAQQTPQYAPLRNAGHEGGDFIFVRKR